MIISHGTEAMDEGEGEGEGEGESDKSESVSESMHQAHGSADEDSGSDDYGDGDGASDVGDGDADRDSDSERERERKCEVDAQEQRFAMIWHDLWHDSGVHVQTTATSFVESKLTPHPHLCFPSIHHCSVSCLIVCDCGRRVRGVRRRA